MNSELAAVWEKLSPEEKKALLFQRQKDTLAMFLQKGAISQEQHDKSLGNLIEKMGMQGI